MSIKDIMHANKGNILFGQMSIKDIEKRHYIFQIQLKFFSRTITEYYDAIIFGFPIRFGKMTLLQWKHYVIEQVGVP
jgi:hypothetical protein